MLDPATSTRRTEAARRRLAEHPTTTALLDAGLRLLLAEFGGPEQDAGPARFFEAVSAARVCRAATRLGPLRVTPGHLRDRWSTHAGYVEDLLAYGLWERQWANVLQAGQRVVDAPTAPAGLPGAAQALAELNLHRGRDAVTHRLELVTAALAAARPTLRATRTRGYAHLDAVCSALYGQLLPRCGLRPAPGADPAALTVALGALAEGANMRLTALGADAAAHRDGVRTLTAGGLLLVSAHWRPGGTGGPGDDGGARLVPPVVGAPRELADVLLSLTDPVTGTRRTPGARRRLAQDGITRQLLDGGIAVLAEEFGVPGVPGAAEVVGGPGASRVFDALSTARVVAQARDGGGAGAGATAAQLRDRWAVQGHYVDDLMSHALAQHRSAASLLLEVAAPGEVLGERAAGVVQRRLREAGSGAGARLKLLVLTLARTRPGVAEALRRLYERDERDMRTLLEGQLAAAGLRLQAGVAPEELARWVVALGDGMVVRLLATGEGVDADGEGSALLRAVQALVGAAIDPDGTGPG